MFELLYVSDPAGISRRLKRKNYLQERGDQSAAEGKGRRQRRKGKEKKGGKEKRKKWKDKRCMMMRWSRRKQRGC